jgi:hypothetical protein
MAELLHAGAWAATAVSTCCVAASGRRLRARELVLALAMLLAMSDVVLGWNLLAPLGWAGVLLVLALVSVAVAPGTRSGSSADRSASAMDALGAVLMAGLLVLMSGDPGASAGSHGAHGPHGLWTSPITGLALAAGGLFAVASVHMAVSMRMPQPAPPARVRVLRRAAPLAMGASVVLMAAVTLA